MLYEVLEWGSGVGEGVTQARYCMLEGVAKGSSAAHAYVVANEAACMRLALAVGLPTPPGIVTVADDGEAYYVSLRFGPKGSRPPPVIPEHVFRSLDQWSLL